jgi:hypothetical protein
MRYYLGLGVGHAHQSGKGCRFSTDGKSREHDVEEIEMDVREEDVENEDNKDGDDSGSDNASNMDEDLSGDDSEEGYSDDGELVAMEEMYGLSSS